MRSILFLLLSITSAHSQQAVDKATIDRWMKELSNWGRWGKTDQAGTYNLITAAKRKAASALAKEGFAVSLARDADTVKSADNGNPFGRKILSSGVDPKPMFAMATALATTASHLLT